MSESPRTASRQAPVARPWTRSGGEDAALPAGGARPEEPDSDRRCGEEEPRQTEGRERRTQRPEGSEARRAEGGDEAPEATRPEAGGILGRQPEVSASGRDREGGRRGGDGAQVAEELGAGPTARHLRLGPRPDLSREVGVEEAGHEEVIVAPVVGGGRRRRRVVVRVLGLVGHRCPDGRNRSSVPVRSRIRRCRIMSRSSSAEEIEPVLEELAEGEATSVDP